MYVCVCVMCNVYACAIVKKNTKDRTDVNGVQSLNTENHFKNSYTSTCIRGRGRWKEVDGDFALRHLIFYRLKSASY